MDKLIINGGTPLHGSVRISGAKNASLPILAATLLTESSCSIKNVPDVSDTNYMVQILNSLGVSIERYSGTVITEAKTIQSAAPYELVSKMRASICMMGPLLARTGKAIISMPGGCVIGTRPIDLHLKGLKALGATITQDGGNLTLEAKNGLKGCEIDLRGKSGPTVLGTANIMMAATLAQGTTIIESAAREPEIEDLANFLINMGAKIMGQGTRVITIEGVTSLHGAHHEVIPDRIEAATYMMAGLITGGEITLKNICRPHLKTIEEKIQQIGHSLTYNADETQVTVTPTSNPQGCEIITDPYPSFPTDAQAQFTSLLALTPGISVIEDMIFPERFMHCAELNRMGAKIEVNRGKAIVHGVAQLTGAPVMASDLRASAALVLAGLAAKGTTEVNRLYHIDRGYEHIDTKLQDLGADLKRVPNSI